MARRLAHVRVSSSALLVGGKELEGCGDGDCGAGNSVGASSGPPREAVVGWASDGDGRDYGASVRVARVGAVAGAASPCCADAKHTSCSSNSAIKSNRAGVLVSQARRRRR